MAIESKKPLAPASGAASPSSATEHEEVVKNLQQMLVRASQDFARNMPEVQIEEATLDVILSWAAPSQLDTPLHVDGLLRRN